MGFLDKAKDMAGGAAEKAADLKDQVPADKLDETVDAIKEKVPGADTIPGLGGTEQAQQPSQPATSEPAAAQPPRGGKGGRGKRAADGPTREERGQGKGQRGQGKHRA